MNGSQCKPVGRFAGTVTITLHDGRKFDSGLVDGGLRFPQPGWDEARMEDKFRWAAGFVLPSERLDALVKLLWRFETLSNVREMFDALGFGD